MGFKKSLGQYARGKAGLEPAGDRLERFFEESDQGVFDKLDLFLMRRNYHKVWGIDQKDLREELWQSIKYWRKRIGSEILGSEKASDQVEGAAKNYEANDMLDWIANRLLLLEIRCRHHRAERKSYEDLLSDKKD